MSAAPSLPAATVAAPAALANAAAGAAQAAVPGSGPGADAGAESPFVALLGIRHAANLMPEAVATVAKPEAGEADAGKPDAAAGALPLALLTLAPLAATPPSPGGTPALPPAVAPSGDEAALVAAMAAGDVSKAAAALLAGQPHAADAAADDVPGAPGAALPNKDPHRGDVMTMVAAAQNAGDAPAKVAAQVALPPPTLSAAAPDSSAAAIAGNLAAQAPPAPPPASAVAPPPVTVPPADPRWAEQIAASVAWSARRETTDVEIRLHPPELGPLRVQLRIDGHRIDAQFSAPQVATRDALADTLPRLRELLHAQGLSLGHAQVSDQRRDAPAPFAPAPEGASAVSGIDDAPAEPVVLRLRHLGMLDEYA